MEPKYPNITVKLIGEDGNAFNILGCVNERCERLAYQRPSGGRRENRIAITTSLRPRAHKTGEAIWCHVLESRASRSATYFFNSTVSTLGHNSVGRAAEGQDGSSAEVVLI
jgi:hypothetical protein